ncbi:MAG: response regulator [Pseudomonadota bacterium]
MGRCIVVEEGGLVRGVVCALLNELNFETVGAEEVEIALGLIHAEATDLVVLDWDLPNLGALDVLTGIASMADGERPYVLIVASECDPKQLALAREAGVTDYILKPIDNDVFCRMVSAISPVSEERVA